MTGAPPGPPERKAPSPSLREELRLAGEGPTVRSLLEGAASGGAAYAIARIQDLRRKQVLVAGGEVEETAAVFSRGCAAHVFDADGHSSLASGDSPGADAAFEVGNAAARGLETARRAGASQNREIFDLPPEVATENPPVRHAWDEVPFAEVLGRVLDLHRDLAGRVPGVRVRTAFHAEREEWRVGRSDGTDVTFAVPRAYLSHLLVLSGNGRAVSVQSNHFGTSYEILLDPADLHRSLGRARDAAALLRRLADAPEFPGGSYPIVMDSSLSKVLAHEAFGHAAESDTFESSILAKDGRFRSGEALASPNVWLIDESIEGDHAYQPWSPNGIRRTRATILEGGVLRDALADVFTARRAGVRVTGAERAESYRNVPLPRMSNIRIELSDAEPLPEVPSVDALTPEAVRDVLVDRGVLGSGPGRHPRVIYLQGFRGGQVNTIRGDFVFNCQALYELSDDGVQLFRPAIFSGSVLEALRAIRRGFGPLELRAMGTCGKWGQSVPSCGGSHWLLQMEPSPQVRLGGK